MPASAVSSTVDVAIWFSEKARQGDDYMQPQKLQRLLYLAQGIYAAKNFGRKLMPATFVADETGPIEPNIFRLFEEGPIKIEPKRLPPEVENFLYEIWRRYSHHATEYINQKIQRHDTYVRAIKKGMNEEITFAEIVHFFSGQDEERKRQKAMIKTDDGRSLPKWTPTARAAAKPTSDG